MRLEKSRFQDINLVKTSFNTTSAYTCDKNKRSMILGAFMFELDQLRECARNIGIFNYMMAIIATIFLRTVTILSNKFC